MTRKHKVLSMGKLLILNYRGSRAKEEEKWKGEVRSGSEVTGPGIMTFRYMGGVAV